MSKSQAKITDDSNIRISRELWVASCRRQLIEEGKMMEDADGRFWLTAKGLKTVEKEMGRYEFRPAMAIMIEQYVLEKHGIMVD